MATSKFNFYPMGIGQLLRQGRLEVPPNQRAYAWKEKQVRYLLQDLNDAIFGSNGGDDYFLGTIVLIQPPGSIPAIVDRQQRLATTAIILARIRDYFLSISREGSARSVEEAFLMHVDIKTEAPVSRIKLSDEDNGFFNAVILPRQGSKQSQLDSTFRPLRQSNKRMMRASDLVKEYIEDMLKTHPPERRADVLVRWVDFIDTKTSVLAVYVPDEVSAFRMFETLNDRGLRASQADILKNYFFSRAGNRLSEAKTSWNTMSVTIEPLATDDRDDDSDEEGDERRNDPVVTYIRHLWVTTHGQTKERDLADKIRIEVTNEHRAMRFMMEASSAVPDYIAISTPNHSKWAGYRQTTRQYIDTLAQHLRVIQIKPLLFAVARHFEPAEADKAFKLCVSWSVRFLIFGGRGGMLDTQYSLRAKEVGTKQITKARELRDAMKRYVPTDKEFQEAFAVARVSRPWLARYYLRALEKTRKELPHPEFVPNSEVADVNLEHVMPLNPSEKWRVDEDVAQAAQKFLGNMVLISVDRNRELGNKSWDEKKEILGKSGYLLTRQVATYQGWHLEEIRDRQAKMAELAVKTWSLDLSE